MKTHGSLLETLAQFRDQRLFYVFLLGICSGLPWVLHGSVLSLWLVENGVNRSMIGLIGVVTAVYAFNWMWAPFVDRIRLPLLYGRFGQRKSWILLCQCCIALAVLGMAQGDPGSSLGYIGLMAALIAVFSATLDISVDAYRITVFKAEEIDVKMPLAAAMATIGWWAGYGFVGGAFAVALGGETVGLAWPTVYTVLFFAYVLLTGVISLIAIPDQDLSALQVSDQVSNGYSWSGFASWSRKTLVEPFKEFFDRCGPQLAITILLLLVLFRLGEAMLGRMSVVFYREIGFTEDQISFYSKFFGGLVTAVFAVLAAVLNSRFGVIRGLFLCGIAMASANLLYALIAVVGPNTNLWLITLLVDNFFQAFATVAFISFISYFTSRTYTGTQYALMASISNFGRTTLAAGSGFVVNFFGGNWAYFFILTALAVIPGLVLLIWVGRLLGIYEAKREGMNQSVSQA